MQVDRALAPREANAKSAARALESTGGAGSVAQAPPLAVLAPPQPHTRTRRRGWLVRRMLVLADLVGLVTAFIIAESIVGGSTGSVRDPIGGPYEYLCLVATLPAWILIAKLYRLYDQDEERTHHPTTDDFSRVFQLVTIGMWLFFVITWATGLAQPGVEKIILFWLLAVVLVTVARSCARALSRRSAAYVQNTVIVGAGAVGQAVARKLLRHPEYGINLLGFVDSRPLPREAGLEGVALLGPPGDLSELVPAFGVERVVIAFSNDSTEDTLKVIRSLNGVEVQIDIVPRLFELVSPSVQIDSLEGLPLVELPPRRISRSSLAIKRSIDIAGALIGLVVTAPLFGYIAWRIKRDSPGPVFYRQTRLGMNQQEFTALKFRTMYVNVDAAAHREYIKRTMDPRQNPTANGLYKLETGVTPFGRFLRRTSLDELPQLINVLRGDMSLVGPRPCIPYETENFLPHHFDRFLVPAGLTGLWQVTARAQATFREALDMDVAYAHGCSLGLDLRLLCRTPLQVCSRRATV